MWQKNVINLIKIGKKFYKRKCYCYVFLQKKHVTISGTIKVTISVTISVTIRVAIIKFGTKSKWVKITSNNLIRGNNYG